MEAVSPPSTSMPLAAPHTSKLSSLEGLNKIGGKSLGLHGTALASINSLATVHVVTRARDETPRMIRLADRGGIALQRLHAAEQSTTVTVTNIFSNFPVRERVAKKPGETSKSIEKMRQLVQAYAFARHPLRIHFTVLQHPHQSLKIVPRPEKNIMDTVVQIFGVQKASQCFVRTWPDGPVPRAFPEKDKGRRYVFEAILMRLDAEPGKLPKGLFFSVDSHPISATRGTGRKLAAVMKECLRKYSCPLISGGVPRDIFIRLNIRWTPGWYDVDIEPAKENVLFLQEDRLITDFETFLGSVYPRRANDSAAEYQAEEDNDWANALQARRLNSEFDTREEYRPAGPGNSFDTIFTASTGQGA